jgi:hypothetical protein
MTDQDFLRIADSVFADTTRLTKEELLLCRAVRETAQHAWMAADEEARFADELKQQNDDLLLTLAAIRPLVVEMRGYMDRMGQQGIRERVDAWLATYQPEQGEKQ